MKNFFVDAFLKKLTDGDTGSTVLGCVAAALLSGNVNWGLMLSNKHTPQSAQEYGKVAAIVVLALWGWKTGKKPALKSQPVPE